jgi:16S rRNA (cytidine1402-2'-O)-methyltransferase
LAALFIVATPIGNLEDITYRAVRILKEADVIACEDTRQTQKLLDHYGIRKPLVSYHEHNEQARASELIERIRRGVTLALVTDAGTPLVSDPGYRIVRAAIDAGIPVVPIPGANAALTALSASGLPTDSFRFCGFLPPKSNQRRQVLERLRGETATLIFYEAPHRILESLDDIAATLGARDLAVGREMTKVHEEFIRGTPASVAAALTSRPVLKGEFTLLIGKSGERLESDEPVRDAVIRLESSGMPRMDAIKQVARERGLSKRDVYRECVPDPDPGKKKEGRP